MDVFFVWYWILHTGCIWIHRYSGMPETIYVEKNMFQSQGRILAVLAQTQIQCSYSLKRRTHKSIASTTTTEMCHSKIMEWLGVFCTREHSQSQIKRLCFLAQKPEAGRCFPLQPWSVRLVSAWWLYIQCYAQNLGIGVESRIHFLPSQKYSVFFPFVCSWTIDSISMHFHYCTIQVATPWKDGCRTIQTIEAFVFSTRKNTKISWIHILNLHGFGGSFLLEISCNQTRNCNCRYSWLCRMSHDILRYANSLF